MDINKHRYYMTQVLLAIFQDCELGKLLAFKGGTSLMMFHGLTRFSTDLDFNLLDKEHTEKVYHRIRGILQRFGRIEDEAIKFYGAILVLNYGKGERMLKVEISTRQYDNHYEVRNLMGTDIRIREFGIRKNVKNEKKNLVTTALFCIFVVTINKLYKKGLL